MTQGPGLYFDGQTGAAQPVTLKLEGTALAVTSLQGATLARWDYSEIEQLSSMADRLRLALRVDTSTARLEVRDPAFAEAIRQHLGIGTPQFRARERRRRRLVVVWTAAAVGMVMAIAVAGLPAIAEFLTPFVSHEMEARIGTAVHDVIVSGVDTKGKGPGSVRRAR